MVTTNKHERHIINTINISKNLCKLYLLKSSSNPNRNMEASMQAHDPRLWLTGVATEGCVLFHFEQKNHTWNHTFPHFDKHQRDASERGCTLVPATRRDDRRRQTGWHCDGNMSETSPSVWHAKRCTAYFSEWLIGIESAVGSVRQATVSIVPAECKMKRERWQLHILHIHNRYFSLPFSVLCVQISQVVWIIGSRWKEKEPVIGIYQ